jgi:hypothetical protein
LRASTSARFASSTSVGLPMPGIGRGFCQPFFASAPSISSSAWLRQLLSLKPHDGRAWSAL